MRRFVTLTIALLGSLFLAGALSAAEPSAPATAEPQDVQVQAVQADEPAAALPAAPAPAAESELFTLPFAGQAQPAKAGGEQGYECPPGVWYCWNATQCSGFCGPGADHWAVCQFGCCACAG